MTTAAEPRRAVVVVAAGSGLRLSTSEPKAFVDLRGVSILERALRGVFEAVDDAQVVVVVPAAKLAAARVIAERVAGPAAAALTLVAGGETRQASVAAGLRVLDPAVDTVLVHDAARALTPGILFDRVARAVVSGGTGVIPALPVSDTIKQVGGGVVIATVDRRDLVHVQTPQGFPRAVLDAAYAAATEEFTDDAALVASAGHPVVVVEGEPRAFKITTPWDLRRAENILGAGGSGLRTGIGIDVHAFDDGSSLWLGGVYWPDESGLGGHSDGDAVVHAVCDAILSAAGLGDLGSRFGTADDRYRDASSDVFLRESLALVAGAGYVVVNVAVQVVGTRPQIAPRRSEIEARLSDLVGAPVTVGATTTDGLGFLGRGEGISAVATALLGPA